MLTTLSTVGYGDGTGSTADEFVFTMVIEFVGITFFSFLMGTISMLFATNTSFEARINERMDQLDSWLLRLEICNQRNPLPLSLYKEVRKSITDALVHDFNLILSEFDYFD